MLVWGWGLEARCASRLWTSHLVASSSEPFFLSSPTWVSTTPHPRSQRTQVHQQQDGRGVRAEDLNGMAPYPAASLTPTPYPHLLSYTGQVIPPPRCLRRQCSAPRWNGTPSKSAWRSTTSSSCSRPQHPCPSSPPPWRPHTWLDCWGTPRPLYWRRSVTLTDQVQASGSGSSVRPNTSCPPGDPTTSWGRRGRQWKQKSRTLTVAFDPSTSDPDGYPTCLSPLRFLVQPHLAPLGIDLMQLIFRYLPPKPLLHEGPLHCQAPTDDDKSGRPPGEVL